MPIRPSVPSAVAIAGDPNNTRNERTHMGTHDGRATDSLGACSRLRARLGLARWGPAADLGATCGPWARALQISPTPETRRSLGGRGTTHSSDSVGKGSPRLGTQEVDRRGAGPDIRSRLR